MFGRAWPLRAPVRDGIVPTWPQLANSNSVPCTVSNINFFTLVFYPVLSFSAGNFSQLNSLKRESKAF